MEKPEALVPLLGNPAACWINGSETVGFAYEPGPDPWIVQYRVANWIPMTAMVFARDEAHARQIVLDMLDHAIECRKKYVADVKETGRDDYRSVSSDRLEEIKTWTLKACPAPKTQMYKVGWASNDTFGFC